jgi:4-hydroxy-2-oxoheptanedioate aldolase
VEEAKQAVAACRYFPDGARSFGPIRAAYYAGADYFANANKEVACIPMIETRQAVERIDDILSVPGISAVYVGPADLSITYGQPPRMDNDGDFHQAKLKVAEACKRHGVIAGIHANAQLAAKHAGDGYQLITVSSDSGAMTVGAINDLKVVRAGAEGTQPVYR